MIFIASYPVELTEQFLPCITAQLWLQQWYLPFSINFVNKSWFYKVSMRKRASFLFSSKSPAGIGEWSHRLSQLWLPPFFLKRTKSACLVRLIVQ